MHASLSSTASYDEFYRLSDPFRKSPFRLAPDAGSEWLSFEICSRLFRAQPLETALVPRLHATTGRLTADVLWTEVPPVHCINERVAQLLRQNRVSGWSTYSVEVKDRRGALLPGCFGFAVTGRGGDFQNELSEMVLLEHSPGAVERVFKGFYFDPQQWDGSDIFLVSGATVIVERVRQILQQAKVTNIQLTPLPEVETPAYLYLPK